MTIPNRVHACADALAAADGSFDERLADVVVRGTPDDALRTELANAAAAWVDGGFGTVVALDALGEEIAIGQLAASEGELRVRFNKASTDATYYFLSARGLAVLLGDKEKAARAQHVCVAQTFAPFSTLGCVFEPWTKMVPASAVADGPASVVPRRIVRDQLAIVPLSVGPLLLANPPADAINPVFETWRGLSAAQLLLCLVDEVWNQDGALQVSLTGPRRRKLAAGLDNLDPDRDFKLISEAADWIYNSGQDAETRHTLFVYELAREWPGEVALAEGFAERAEGALEAAKTAFRLHVRDASKETLKSLQDLRKTLADDVTRVVTQTRELSSSLWRDLLVVVAAVLGRFTLFAAPGAGEAVFAEALLYGLAAYLLFSVGMTLFANGSFMAIFRTAQADWQTRLYGFVDPADFKTLAADPLAEAETVYRRTRTAAIIAYGLAIMALIALAATTPAAPPAKTGEKTSKKVNTKSADPSAGHAGPAHDHKKTPERTPKAAKPVT